MKKLCYEINPLQLAKNQAYNNLSPIQKLIFRELLDILWSQEDQFSIKYDVLSISCLLSFDVDVLLIQKTIDALSDENNGLLKQVFCLNDGFILTSPELKNQIEYFNKLEKAQIELIEKKKVRGSNKSLLLRTKEKELSASDFGYLEPKDRDLTTYKGWIPTIRFEESGQVYFVKQELLEQLNIEFPNVNIDKELESIMFWSVKNPDRRKTIFHMSSFIRYWLKKSKNPLLVENKEESVFDQLDYEFKKMIEEEEKNMSKQLNADSELEMDSEEQKIVNLY